MSEFNCPIVEIESLSPIDNADMIEVAKAKNMDYSSVVRKGSFTCDDRSIYLPENSIVPQNILENMGLWDFQNGKGKLSGSRGNRIKPIKLRSILSEGIFYKLPSEYIEYPIGFDMAEILNVVKYEPQIPGSMSGVAKHYSPYAFGFDFNARKLNPNLINDGEEVAITQKLHGSFCRIGIVPKDQANPDFYCNGRVFLSSKGLGSKGIIFYDVEKNEENIYTRAFRKIEENVRTLIFMMDLLEFFNPIYLLGEVIGPGIQKGFDYGLKDVEFRGFDIYSVSNHSFLPYDSKKQWFKIYNIPMVETLYIGPFSKEIMEQYAYSAPNNNKNYNHIEEGVVATTLVESTDHRGRRKICKELNPNYLLLKDNTEYQ